MKTFMDKDFLLQTETAQKLYNDYAAATPILDYHCHINPQEIYEDRQFENITQVWLGGDHYKWRFMRSCGVDERFITGDASDKEKFLKWAEVLGKAIGNPHPEQGARPACHDRRRHSHDITGTDRCRQRRAECAETRHLSVLAVFFVCNNVSDRKRQLRDLKSPQTDRQKYANRKDQHDQGNSPDKIINDL